MYHSVVAHCFRATERRLAHRWPDGQVQYGGGHQLPVHRLWRRWKGEKPITTVDGFNTYTLVGRFIPPRNIWCLISLCKHSLKTYFLFKKVLIAQL